MLARIRKAQEEREGGFTLIELLVVIIIIGILAAIAIPVFLKQKDNGYRAAVKSDLKNMATAEEAYATDNDGDYSATLADLTNEGYRQTDGVLPTLALFDATAPSAGYCLKASNSKLSSAPGNATAPFWITNQGVDAGKVMETKPTGC